MVFPRIVAVMLLVHVVRSSLPAQGGAVFTHLTVQDGLSQGSVNCILQDTLGFVWLGTQDGLNRFDGYEVRVYKHDAADPGSLSDNWIIGIAEDTSGTLWIRTLNSPTVDRFDRATETFRSVPLDSMATVLRRSSTVKAELDETGGIRWRGTIGAGLTRTDLRTGATRQFRHDPADPRSLSDDRVYSVFRDRSSILWVGTREGLNQLDERTGTFTRYAHREGDPGSLSDNWVWPILEDHAGNLWVGTFRGGVNRFDRTTGKFTRYRHDPNDPRSLAGDQIYALYQDRAGVIWVGTNDNGVDRFHPDLNAFRHISRDPVDPQSLPDNNILSIHCGRSGSVWVGTRAGLARSDGRTGRFTTYRNVPGDPRSIGDSQVQCMLEASDGVLWIGTVGNGLDRYDPGTGTFAHFRSIPGDSTSLSDNRVYALCEDRDGALWIGTYAGGLNRLDPGTKKFTRYEHNAAETGSLGAPGVFALSLDSSGTLWVGTFGGGLDRLERRSGTFTHFRHAEDVPGSISDDLIASLLTDREGRLWVGTTGGLNTYEPATGTFTTFRTKDGLPNDVIFGILQDDGGNLWMSTNKGLSRFDPAGGTFWNFDYNDGLQGDEFNQNAFARDPVTGKLFFGGGNGLTVFHPDSVRKNPYVPPIAFTRFIRYNTDDGEGKPIEGRGVDVSDGITLSYKDNVVQFTFSALSFHNSARNAYAYRLEGYSDNWIQLGSGRMATFTNLDGGEYVLRVRASNSTGLWNDEGTALRIVVTPPWWRTRLAYVSYGLLFVAVLYGLRRFELNRREQKARMRESELRTKAIEAEKRALEAENERKTKELEDARRLQLSMLPREVPQLPGYELAVFMKTATEVGGDYYDFITGEDGTLHVGFGDATGHGMQAGTIVTLMKGLFLSHGPHTGIQAFFQHCSRTIKEIRLDRLFMAFTFVRIKGAHVAVSSAGMPPAFLYRAGSGQLEEISVRGLPLGAMKNAPYGLREFDLDPGDLLLLSTDGLPEQKNAAGEMFDYSRLRASLASSLPAAPGDVITSLVRESEAWMDGVALEDDITLLVIRRLQASGIN